MTHRIQCRRCDNQILEATARKNDGLCAICKRDDNTAAFEAVVQGWIDHPETLPGTNGIPLPEGFSLQLAARQLKSRLFPDDDDRMELVCEKYFDAAHRKWGALGSFALSKKEKYVLAVETFYGEVMNGGLRQFVDNESGAFAGWAAEAFEAIGIPAYAAILRTLMSLFAQGVIPEDPGERAKQVEAIDGERLEALEQLFWDRYSTNKTEIRRSLFQFVSA